MNNNSNMVEEDVSVIELDGTISIYHITYKKITDDDINNIRGYWED